MDREPKIFISAGEASGDLYGALLAEAIRRQAPGAKISGIGLSKMRKAGVELLVDLEGHSVMGITEVLSSLLENYGNLRRAGAFFRTAGIDTLVLIDYAGFNLRLAKLAKDAGVRVCYFIPPKLWAWGEYRAKKMRALVDRVYAIFPFEKEFFSTRGIDARFFGHPIFDLIGSSGFDLEEYLEREKKGANGNGRDTIILMPGSRKLETGSLAPVMAECAAAIASKRNGGGEYDFVIPLAPGVDGKPIAKVMRRFDAPFRFVTGELEKYRAFSRAALAIAASGTATLELAIFGVPMVILYRVALLTEIAGRLLVNTRFVGLPNIVHGRKVVPELLQREANADNVLYHARKYLDSANTARATRAALLGTAGILGYDPLASPVEAAARDIIES